MSVPHFSVTVGPISITLSANIMKNKPELWRFSENAFWSSLFVFVSHVTSYVRNLAVIKLLFKLLLNTEWTLICFGSQTVKNNLGWTSKQSFTVIYQIVLRLKGRAMILTSLILHSIFTRFPSWLQICWSYKCTISFPISLSKVLKAQNII